MRFTLLTLLLPSSALAETEIRTSHGDSASFTRYTDTEDGCSQYSLDLTVSETISHSSETHGAPTGSLAGWFFYGVNSWCDGENDYWYGTIGEDSVFWVAPSGRSATLEATVELTHWSYDDDGPSSSETILADVEVAWTAISAPYSSIIISKNVGAWGAVNSRTRSTSRDAAVSGTIFDIDVASMDDWDGLATIATSSYGEFYSYTY